MPGPRVPGICRVRRLAWPIARSLHRLPAVAAGWRGGSSSLLTLDPLETALRHGSSTDILPIHPDLIDRPGVELRLAVTALGAGVLRYVTGSGEIVESAAVTPVAGEGAGPVDLVHGVLASASAPMISPPRDGG